MSESSVVEHRVGPETKIYVDLKTKTLEIRSRILLGAMRRGNQGRFEICAEDISELRAALDAAEAVWRDN